MKLKLDDQGHAVLKDGMPVYVHDDGKEAPFDAAATVATIRARNAEAREHRERAEAAEKALKAFDGIEDAAAARKALETFKNLDQKKLVDAGEVERLKGDINKAWQEKLDAEAKRAQTLEQQLHGEIVGGAFARSKFITENLAIPADMAQAFFGRYFKVEEGKLRAVDVNGNPIHSRTNPGSPASFDEAIEFHVESYPSKTSILKATQGAGSGAPTGGTSHGGGKTITRGEFNKLPPTEQARLATADGVNIVDIAA